MALDPLRVLGSRAGSVVAPRRPLAKGIRFLISAPVVGIVGLGAYAVAVSSFTALATGLLIAAAAAAVGGLLGFLFALPRTSAGPAAHGGHTPGPLRSSTSLEEIADWLTKILVGLGLVELGKLVKSAHQLIDFLGPALGPAEGSRRAVALALLWLFTVTGFLVAYLGTRIMLTPEFAHVEAQLRAREADVSAAETQLETFVGNGRETSAGGVNTPGDAASAEQPDD